MDGTNKMKAHVTNTTTVTQDVIEVISEKQCTIVIREKTVRKSASELPVEVTYRFRVGHGENAKWISEREVRALVECLLD
jgi:hypothetical protein